MKKNTTTATICTISDLINVLNTAKCGGQFATVTAETEMTLRVNPTDGWDGGKRDKSKPIPTNRFTISYHFGQDYERAMAKALGVEDYEGQHREGKVTLIPNLLYKWETTGNYVMAFIVADRTYIGRFVEGRPITDEENEYYNHYKPISGNEVVMYRTIGVHNITRLAIGGVEYLVDIPKQTAA